MGNPFENFIGWLLCGIYFFFKGYECRRIFPDWGDSSIVVLIGDKKLTDEELKNKYYQMTFNFGVNYMAIFKFVFNNPIK